MASVLFIEFLNLCFKLQLFVYGFVALWLCGFAALDALRRLQVFI